MVLDVTGTNVIDLGAVKFGKDGLVWFSNNVGQHVQSTTVGHTNDNVFNAQLNGSVDQGFETWDQRFSPFQTESLVTRELSGQEGFERGGPDQTVQDLSFLIRGELEWTWVFQSLSNPVAFLSGWNMGIFNGKMARVDGFQVINDFSQLQSLDTVVSGKIVQDTWTQGDFSIQIFFVETVVFET